MKLTKQSVEEFIAIYKEEFGTDITYTEAEEMGNELITFYQLIIPKNTS